MKGVWKKVKAKYGFTDGIDAPIIIRYCAEHQRFEWFDPCNRWGGIAINLHSLKNSLKKLYRCYCGLYHVYDVVVILHNTIQRYSFINFISE
ncbi:MAG: hypothetical protein QXP96_04935 [Thermoproteota archaeon]